MAKYRITRSVRDAYGWQTYLVEASSKEEALAKHLAGQDSFEDESIEVASLHGASLEDVEEV